MKLFKNPFSKLESLVANFSWDIGVDLGSSNTLIYLKERGVVADEPTMMARLRRKRWTGLSAPKTNRLTPIAYGFKAKEMLNREPKQIEVVSPLKNGIISDLEAIESMISHQLRMVYEIPSRFPKIFKPRVIVGVPGSINDVQKRAVRASFLSAGAREVVMIEESVLAAIGVGLPVERTTGLAIIDIGGGKTEVSVISMGGVVVGKGSKIAGLSLDISIANYIKMKYGILIGQNSAEKIKIEASNLLENDDEDKKVTVVRGRDLETGLPKSIKIGESEIREAIILEVRKIVRLVSEVLDETPPELMNDILKRGILLVGNGAKIKGLERLIEVETKISTRLADDPGMSVIKGCGELIENQSLLKTIKLIAAR